MIWDKLQTAKKQLAKYLQMSLYIQPHSTANEASSSLSTFKDASIFIIQKGGSQCKPRHKLNIILSLNSFYCSKSCYCVRWRDVLYSTLSEKVCPRLATGLGTLIFSTNNTSYNIYIKPPCQYFQ